MKIIYSLIIALSLSPLPTLIKPMDQPNYDNQQPLPLLAYIFAPTNMIYFNALWSVACEMAANRQPLYKGEFITEEQEETLDEVLRVIGFFNLPSVIKEIKEQGFGLNKNQQQFCLTKAFFLTLGITALKSDKIRKALQRTFPGIEVFFSLKGVSQGNILFGHTSNLLGRGVGNGIDITKKYYDKKNS